MNKAIKQRSGANKGEKIKQKDVWIKQGTREATERIIESLSRSVWKKQYGSGKWERK